jgi:hypothetical protein
MKKQILLLLFIITLTIKHSLAAGLSIQPVYGIERTQRQFPEPPKYVTKTFIGIAAIYGIPAISAELELGQSITKDDFPADNMEVTYTTQRAMLGIRSYPIHSKMLGIFFRAGGRAQKEIRDITENGVSTKEEGAVNFDPYAGTGLTFVLGDNFALNAGATLVYNRDAAASEQYDTQYTFSFTIKAGSGR